MKATTIKIDVPSREDVVRIVLLGDTHVGNANTDEALIGDVVKRLQAPLTFWIHVGDACEFINMSDRRFDPRLMPDWVGVPDLGDLAAAQCRRTIKLFEPARDNCLAWLKGNHEALIERKYETNVYERLCRGLEIPEGRRLGYSGFVRLVIARAPGNSRGNVWEVVLFLAHGHGGGLLAGSKALKLERLPMAYQADIYAIGHTHTKMVLQKRRLSANRRDKIVESDLIMVNVGGWMRGEHGGYPELKLLYPQAIGPVEVWLYPGDRSMRVIM